MTIGTIIIDIATSLLALAVVTVVVAGIGWGLLATWEWWEQHQRARAARIEAELDAAAAELHDTIMRLAEALAEERVSAEMTRREMLRAAQAADRG